MQPARNPKGTKMYKLLNTRSNKYLPAVHATLGDALAAKRRGNARLSGQWVLSVRHADGSAVSAEEICAAHSAK